MTSLKALITSIIIISFSLLALLFYSEYFSKNTINHLTHGASSSDYHELRKEFNRIGAWGLHTTIDLKSCDPKLIRSEESIKAYVHQLCGLIDMKRFGPTVVIHFGQEERVAGYSMYQLIETSNISGHFANDTNGAYIDIFSCKLYDPEVVRNFTANFFKGTINSSNVIFRI